MEQAKQALEADNKEMTEEVAKTEDAIQELLPEDPTGELKELAKPEPKTVAVENVTLQIPSDEDLDAKSRLLNQRADDLRNR